MTTRITTLALMAAAVVLVELTVDPKPAARFVWNASQTVPIGLYDVQPAHRLVVTDLVVAFPPEPLATFLAEGGYLSRGVPLIKRILALPEHMVCRNDSAIPSTEPRWVRRANVTAAAAAPRLERLSPGP